MKPIISFLLLLSASALAAQTIYTRADTIPVTQDSVTLKAGEFRGLIQWQHSADRQTWENISGKTTGELKIAGTSTGYYRAEITDGTCFPVYSDTAFIQAAADTAEVQSPEVPTPPGDSRFDSILTDEAANNAIEQYQDGSPGADKIVQYGGTATTAQYAYGNDGNDWILQQGGNNTTIQQVSADMGNDTVYQFAGSTGTVQSITGADGIQTLIQVGGDGTDTMRIQKGYANGNSTIQQYGGAGNDTISGAGGAEDDTIAMYGQAGNDTMTYNLTTGTDAVTINGGSGTDAVTINMGDQKKITLQDADGNVLYTSGDGGTTITVLNTEKITVKDAVGNVLFQR